MDRCDLILVTPSFVNPSKLIFTPNIRNTTARRDGDISSSSSFYAKEPEEMEAIVLYEKKPISGTIF